MAAPGLFEDVVGPSWRSLPDVLQRVHSPGRAQGVFDIERGTGLVTSLVAFLCGMPPAERAVPVRLDVTALGVDEEWARNFGPRRLTSFLRKGAAGVLLEQYGIVECRLAVAATDGALDMRSTGAALRLGALRVPLPHLLAPDIEGRATAKGETAEVDVAIRSGWGALLVRYRGAVRKEAE